MGGSGGSRCTWANAYSRHSLDAASTELIGHIIRDWFTGWTVIAITHDAASLLDYDAVVSLENGRLLGYGPPQGGNSE